MNRRGFLKLFGLGAIATAVITNVPKILTNVGQKIKTAFNPHKIKPVGVWRNSGEYIKRNSKYKKSFYSNYDQKLFETLIRRDRHEHIS